MRRKHSVVTALAAACALCALGAGCDMPAPQDAEIGCAYSAQSSPLCPGYEAGKPEGAAFDGEVLEGDGGEGGLVSGLGMSCTSSADCASFAADYCLIAPGGGFASFCTYTHCTAAVCGASYGCCDCAASPIALVNTYPPGICVPPSLAAAAPSYGCTCVSSG